MGLLRRVWWHGDASGNAGGDVRRIGKGITENHGVGYNTDGSEVCGGNLAEGGGRLNLLLSSAPWRVEPWAESLPRVLEPMGVRTIFVNCARTAERVIRSTPVHVAVVDIGLPLDERCERGRLEDGGERVLELLSRLGQSPPTVVIRASGQAATERREMRAALRCNAFAVVERTSADLESMLRIMQRVLNRYYQNRWPGAGGDASGGAGVGM
jgi:hypothetical protein